MAICTCDNCGVQRETPEALKGIRLRCKECGNGWVTDGTFPPPVNAIEMPPMSEPRNASPSPPLPAESSRLAFSYAEEQKSIDRKKREDLLGQLIAACIFILIVSVLSYFDIFKRSSRRSVINPVYTTPVNPSISSLLRKEDDEKFNMNSDYNKKKEKELNKMIQQARKAVLAKHQNSELPLNYNFLMQYELMEAERLARQQYEHEYENPWKTKR